MKRSFPFILWNEPRQPFEWNVNEQNRRATFLNILRIRFFVRVDFLVVAIKRQKPFYHTNIYLIQHIRVMF